MLIRHCWGELGTDNLTFVVPLFFDCSSLKIEEQSKNRGTIIEEMAMLVFPFQDFFVSLLFEIIGDSNGDN